MSPPGRLITLDAHVDGVSAHAPISPDAAVDGVLSSVIAGYLGLARAAAPASGVLNGATGVCGSYGDAAAPVAAARRRFSWSSTARCSAPFSSRVSILPATALATTAASAGE